MRGVKEARARWIGHRVYSDGAIEADPELPVREAGAYGFREGLERFTHGNHLGEHLGAIAILPHHFLNRSDLTRNLPQAQLQ